MRFFFRSRKFKIMVTVVSIILVVSIVLTAIFGFSSPISNLIGSISAPIQAFFTDIGSSVTEFFNKLNNAETIMLKNEELKDEISKLQNELIDYEQIKEDNEFYKDYLDLKDRNPDFEFEKAGLISKNADDVYKSFLIDKGTLQGVSLYDPVITNQGLVGYVGEVASNYSKVITVLDPSLSCGAYDSRTKDVGVLEGNLESAKQNKARIKNLSRTSSVAIGDMIVTSGGGVFPSGLLIGTLETLHREDYAIGVYGIIAPAVDFDSIKNVMVITGFSGQGNVMKSGE